MSKENPLVTANRIGQSIWIDDIQRSMIEKGEIKDLINNDAIAGLTSNPSIFEAAIAKTTEYDSSIAEITSADSSVSDLEIFNQLAIADIQAAADEFAEVYKTTGGQDGMVSLEVPPDLAHDAAGTVKTGLELNKRLDRDNVMIKVPGTKAGVEAFEKLTAEGVNVNVTLLFSVNRYKEIAQAYIRGLEARAQAGLPIDSIASVASFFVSRVDVAADTALQAASADAELEGKTGIANAKVAYAYFANIFGSEAWQALSSKGAKPQRLLWASTGTKNPEYKDTYYIEELMGPQTVNTIPPKTLDAFRDHGIAENRLATNLDKAREQLTALQQHKIVLSDITDKLEADGLASFADAFDRLLASIAEKRKNLS